MLSKNLKMPRVLFKNLKNPRSVSGELLTVRYISHTARKISCVISKKTVSKAYKRNLLKRRVFSIAKEACLKPLAYFIFPKTKAATASYQDIKKEMQYLCDKIN